MFLSLKFYYINDYFNDYYYYYYYHYFNFFAADDGQNTIQHVTVMKVPVATAETICSIRVVSKSPKLADPSRTTITKIIIKQRLQAKINK